MQEKSPTNPFLRDFEPQCQWARIASIVWDNEECCIPPISVQQSGRKHYLLDKAVHHGVVSTAPLKCSFRILSDTTAFLKRRLSSTSITFRTGNSWPSILRSPVVMLDPCCTRRQDTLRYSVTRWKHFSEVVDEAWWGVVRRCNQVIYMIGARPLLWWQFFAATGISCAEWHIFSGMSLRMLRYRLG